MLNPSWISMKTYINPTESNKTPVKSFADPRKTNVDPTESNINPTKSNEFQGGPRKSKESMQDS